MDNLDSPPIDVPLHDWVQAAKPDGVLYGRRQIVEILLTAIGLSENLNQALYLKGGTLMALAFGSERVTADIDFTCVVADHTQFSNELASHLDQVMRRAATKLGYLDLLCRTQTVKKMPRATMFKGASFPALKVKIAYAKRGTGDEQRLLAGNGTHTIEMDISFNEQVHVFQELFLADPLVAIRAYSLAEILAEKYRALVQQKTRNRTRRQDVYDIAFLLESGAANRVDPHSVLDILKSKSASRNLEIDRLTLRDEEIAARAQKEWETISDEISGKLPDFDAAFHAVRTYYEALPWDNT